MRLKSAAGAFAATTAACVTYSAVIERRAPRLRRLEVPVLAAGSRPLRVLHLSDTHFTPRQAWKRDWIRDLADLRPDLVVNTGDSIAHPDAVPTFLEAVEPLLDRPGVFVFGSNDYFAPTFKNPACYLFPDTGRRLHGVELPWEDLRDGMLDGGWLDLSNRSGRLKADERDVAVAGVDDPHIDRDRYSEVRGSADPDADLRLGVVHAPSRRVLDAMAADGFDLILAGHTHGGQLRVPGVGALVTNCDLDRRRARGLSRVGDAPGAFLNVSAGLGTSPWAPVRFACPPEASLLTLVAA